MLDVMERGLAALMREGYEGEAFGMRTRFTSIRIEDGRISGLDGGEVLGIGIRCAISGKVGFSYTTDPQRIEGCVKEAIKLAKVAGSDFRGFPDRSSDYPSVDGIFDPDILEFDPDRGVEYATILIDAAKEVDGRIDVTGGEFSVSSASSWIVNSNGVEVCENSTSVGASVSVALGEVAAWQEQEARLLAMIDCERIGREAALLAVRSQNPVKIETGIRPVILMPPAISSLLSYTTINHLLAESVQEMRSPYRGKVGEEVMSPLLSITDDGRLNNGVGSGIFDGEGVPTQRTVLVEEGVLKGFLYDTYTARKDGVESTGNATRTFDTTPAVGPTNFIIEPGTASGEDLITEVQDGILVTDLIGAHTASRTSGEFSLLVHNGFRIESGEMTDPIRQVMISGSTVDLLRNVSLIGSDTRQYGAVVSPSILFEDVQVTQ